LFDAWSFFIATIRIFAWGLNGRPCGGWQDRTSDLLGEQKRMAATSSRPDWQLPPGVTPGGWQYTEARFIAEDYDRYFAEHGLLHLDMEIARRHIARPGTLVDLGCGTGRALLPWIREGYRGIAVDLSQAMLDVVRRKAEAEGLPVMAVRGNLVELDFLQDASVDYAICFFSTLGMIEGDEHRLAALRHVRRILRPSGTFILHVHNYWHNFWMPQGRSWLLGNWIRSCMGRAPRGDKRYDYRGIRNFFLHVFTRGELRRLLRDSGLHATHWYPVNAHGDALLSRPWLAGNWRAQGWIVVCQ
jgi:SAM-dependent methyltransferase